MTPESYYYIALAYLSIATLTTTTLCIKGVMVCVKSNRKLKWVQYMLHSLHVPPYLIAAYWYYDAYSHMSPQTDTEAVNSTTYLF